MLEGLGRRFFCTLPVEDLAESIKNKTELWPFFAFDCGCERNLIMFFFDFGLILNHDFSLKNQ